MDREAVGLSGPHPDGEVPVFGRVSRATGGLPGQAGGTPVPGVVEVGRHKRRELRPHAEQLIARETGPGVLEKPADLQQVSR